MAKDVNTDKTPRHIGFRELKRENLPDFYANSSECIDTRYKPGVPEQVGDNKNGELRKRNKLLYPFLEEERAMDGRNERTSLRAGGGTATTTKLRLR